MSQFIRGPQGQLLTPEEYEQLREQQRQQNEAAAQEHQAALAQAEADRQAAHQAQIDQRLTDQLWASWQAQGGDRASFDRALPDLLDRVRRDRAVTAQSETLSNKAKTPMYSEL
jgi:hypothetical protein